MDGINMALYLIVNAFHIYVFAEAYRIIFGSPRKLGWVLGPGVAFLAFAVFYVLNSTAFLTVGNPFLNMATSIFPLLLITLLFTGKVMTKLALGLFIYLASMLLESICVSLLEVTKLSMWVKNIVVANLAADLILFLFIEAYEKIRLERAEVSLGGARWLAIIFLPLSSLMIVVMVYIEDVSPIISMSIVALLLLTNVVALRIYDLLRHLYASNQEQILVQRQNEAYAHEIQLIQGSLEGSRIQRHDFANHIMVLENLLGRGQVEASTEYIKSFAGNYLGGGEYVSSGNTAIDSILNFKLAQAERLGAQLEVSVVIPNEIPVQPTDVVAILGNLLDNANEALVSVEDKWLKVDIHFQRGALFIQVENSYDGEVKKSRKNGRTVYLTKKADPEKHSLGLTSVSKAVEKYAGFLKIDDTTKSFRVAILFPADLNG